MNQDNFQMYQSEESHYQFNLPQIIPSPINFNRFEENNSLYEAQEEADFPNNQFLFFPSSNRFRGNNFDSLPSPHLYDDYDFLDRRSTGEDTNYILIPKEEKENKNIFDSNNQIADNSINNIEDNEDENEEDNRQNSMIIEIDEEHEPVLRPLFQIVHQKPLGRRPKDDLTSDRDHTGKSNDNAFKKCLTKCTIQIWNFINSKIYPHGKLKKPNITQFLPLKVDLKKVYLEQNIRIFFENYPEPKYALNKNSYRIHNRNLLNLLDLLDNQEINSIFYASFIDYFLAFFNNDRIINGNIFLNKYFKTYDECFNDYSEEEKNSIKEYCIKLINGELKPRKSRKKKNNKKNKKRKN